MGRRDDDREETAFDFRRGVRHLVDTAIQELDDERPTAELEVPKHLKDLLKEPEPRDAPTQFIDAQQASVDRAVAQSLVTGEQKAISSDIPVPRALSLPDLDASRSRPGAPPPIAAPPRTLSTAARPLTRDLELPPRIVVGKPADEESALALDIEAIAARPVRPQVWTPEKPPPSASIPRAFWIAALVFMLIVIAFVLLR